MSASVIVLSKDAIMALVNAGLIGGGISDSGELILTTKGGDDISLGNFDHGTLLGLGDDDHAQYALADGSRTFAHISLSGLTSDDHTEYALADGTRGDFATVAQGTAADAARPNLNSTTAFDGGSGTVVEEFDITIDGTDTNTWPDRWRWKIRNGAGALRYVTYLNEVGELRLVPSKHNTVSTRWFVIDSTGFTDGTPRSSDVPIAEMMDDRVNRNSIWSLMPNGDQTYGAAYNRMARVIVLGALDPVPSGTPSGTVIVRTS